MNTYILILYVFALPFTPGDPVEKTVVAQKTYESCTTEGRRKEALYQGNATKALRFTCAKSARAEEV